ncbi:MAG: putative amidohydrolase [Verrucomicrobiales bacterium]|jgi:predicted amidohydrolase
MTDSPRMLRVAAAQLGPIAKDEPRTAVVERLRHLLADAATHNVELVVFPELALTTFFPRWYTDDISGHDHYYETAMPGPETQPLFDDAKSLGIGFALGYAELTPEGERFNTTILVERDGTVVGTYRKVHIPGHDDDQPWRPFQHLERRYFQESNEGFGVHRAFDGIVGMATCNDRRWPETYREMGLQGVELIMIGYNTPIHYAPDPGQNALQGFHNHLCMQAGAYQNGTWVVGVAKGGTEEGVESLAQSAIIAPSGQIIAQAMTTGDEVIVADCNLDWCANYKDTLFNFSTYRRPELYQRITSQKGVIEP